MNWITLIFGFTLSGWSAAPLSESIRPPFESIPVALKQLADANSRVATYFEYGLSIEKRPLFGIRKSNPEVQRRSESLPTSASAAIVITAAFHGDEYNGFEDRLPEQFLAQLQTGQGLKSFLAMSGVVYIIPVYNPDGYVANPNGKKPGKRGNANGADLNRDFPVKILDHDRRSRQPETIAFDRLIENEIARQGIQFTLMWNYHCCAPALIYRYGDKRANLPETDLALYQEVGAIAQNHLGASWQGPKYLAAPHHEIFDYSAIGTAEDHYYERYGTLAFVFEGTDRKKEAKQFHRQLAMWNDIFAWVARYQPVPCEPYFPFKFTPIDPKICRSELGFR